LKKGTDLKMHDRPAARRTATIQVEDDPLSAGALVTTHRIDVYEAACDLSD
jgi:hypothetical protein